MPQDPSLPFTIISMYPSVEHPGKVAVLVQYKDGIQKVLYLTDKPVYGIQVEQ